jgi:hypothetical protein
MRLSERKERLIWPPCFPLKLTYEVKKMEDDLMLKDLERYCGTEQYHNVLGSNVTDGIAYVMKNGYSWFIIDSLAVIVHSPIMRNEDFLCVKLKLIPEKKAEMLITDGNDRILYTQKYEYTDAKKELTLFYENGVLLLSNEH